MASRKILGNCFFIGRAFDFWFGAADGNFKGNMHAYGPIFRNRQCRGKFVAGISEYPLTACFLVPVLF
jgi:hypothetical protein